jgi:hypothetical protein
LLSADQHYHTNHFEASIYGFNVTHSVTIHIILLKVANDTLNTKSQKKIKYIKQRSKSPEKVGRACLNFEIANISSIGITTIASKQLK